MILKTIAAQLLMTVMLSVAPTVVGNNQSDLSPRNISAEETPRDTLTIIIPTKKFKVSTRTRGFFMGFKLESSCDTNVSEQLKAALTDYSGPDIMITSLKRHYNRKSKHFCGNAVDLQFRHELIEWLVSEDGQRWLSAHNMLFYIEGRPGSRKLIRYKSDKIYSKYILENPHATGDHIHINIK
jgi:hypothetical protein